MFYLHVSNRTEHLLRQLAEVLTVSERSLFEKEIFLIPSQGMERMISQYLATVFRSWCNFQYLFPHEFLNIIAYKSGIPLAVEGYYRNTMVWRIEKLLREIEGDPYGPILSYMQNPNGQLKRFQLALQLANLFDQYQLMRPDMLANWERGKVQTNADNEAWQMALWQSLCQQLEGVPHRGTLLQMAIDFLKEGRPSQFLPTRVSVFGVNSMPPIFLEYFNSLAEHCDIHLYLLSPCREYWRDVETRKAQLRRKIKAGNREQGQGFFGSEHHPLLASLGQQGRDFQRMLLELVEFTLEFESYETPVHGETPSVLQQLQLDLLTGEVNKNPSFNLLEDDSVQIVSCHSKVREITILKDYLHRLLDSDPSLELRDIVVMAPEIQEYAPLIPAIFNDIQHSIADRSLARRNGTLAAFCDFLEILDGRFGWGEVLALLQKDVVNPHFDLSSDEIQTLQKWILDAGIRWGLSADQRSSQGLPEFSENSWAAGLDRLLMGYAMSGDEVVDGILPVPGIEGGASQALGGLCQFMSLFERAHLDFNREYSLQEWSALLISYSIELFGEDNESELLEVHGLLSELADVHMFHGENVSFDVIRSWLDSSTQESRSSSGFLRGQLTFCTMLPMRSIPFKVVCLLGVNDGAFPKMDRRATFDLMVESARVGDRSQREDDRYQFLEALLAARQSLYISYVGQSIISNDMIPPSVVVTELLEILEADYGIKDLVVAHPLHPFSYRYFQKDDEKIYSYNNHYCQTAKMLAGQEKPQKSWWQGTKRYEPENIQLTDLLRFYTHPQRFFMRECLGVMLGSEEGTPPDSESFALDSLENYHVENELLDVLLSGNNTSTLLDNLRLQGRWPLGGPGEVEFDKKVNELTDFSERMVTLDLGKKLPDFPIDLEISGYQIRGFLSNLYEGGIVVMRHASLGGRDLLAGWIYHLVTRYYQDLPQQVFIVTKDKRLTFTECKADPNLEVMLGHFIEGCRRPIPFYVSPAFVYTLQFESRRAKIPPLVKAQVNILDTLEKGYDHDLSLLLQGGDKPHLGDEFEGYCQEIMLPIWRSAHGC